jgi:site-specific DNA-methyltransferase (adenine-specific)
MTSRILHGSCIDLLPTLEAESVHAVVTDPPYHLTTGKKGGTGDASVNLDSPHGRARVTAGFMGKKWDGGDVAFRPETWREVFRVMRPGAYLVAFGGTRTYHRLACAIEDAGFEIRDQLGWIYGSGFPKGTDKAKIPEGWEGWNTALKPAWEPIVLARKPMIGTLAANLDAYDCGAMNIDGCRVLVEGEERAVITGKGGIPARNSEHESRDAGVVAQAHELGRWPANIIHDGSEEVLAHFPEAPGQFADVKYDEGERKTQSVYGAMKRGHEPSAERRYGEDGIGFQMLPGARRDDGGSAARFFYCAKADREDRDHGLQGMPLRTGGIRSETSGQHITRRDGGAPGPVANHHPTVKPTDLMRWLVRLVTPPGGTVLDPFLGSGSTGRAALLENFNFIGMELEDEYLPIARARIGIVDPDSFALGAG